ncbi:MAG: MBL fold metallo-hydrolase [Clostridia bacterium]|nr:MBL fold metallo-hydrolase [Clostridia bacterium]
MITINCYHVGPLITNCYLLTDSKTQDSLIIDPGGISRDLDKKINEIGPGKVKYIVLTHGHFDHIRKVARYKKLTKAKVVANSAELPMINDEEINLSKRYTSGIDKFEVEMPLDNNDEFYLGENLVRMLATPGHTKGSACFLVEGDIFSGDTIMKDCIGRTDLATGSEKDMMESLKRLKNFTKDYTIYPGHGEKTSLQYEKANNPFFKLEM